MRSKVPKPKSIKPLEGYTVMTDADIVARATAVQTGMTGNSNFHGAIGLPALQANPRPLYV